MVAGRPPADTGGVTDTDWTTGPDGRATPRRPMTDFLV
jgi:hypothetical protein